MPNNVAEMVWSITVLAIQVYISALILGTLLNYLVRTNGAWSGASSIPFILGPHSNTSRVGFVMSPPSLL